MSVVNGYVYAGNSPFGLFDPTGTSFLETVRDIVVGAVAAWVASMVVGALIVSNVLTGGIAGVIEGAIIGAVVGAVVGGVTVGVIHGVDAMVNGRDFFQGFGEGSGMEWSLGQYAENTANRASDAGRTVHSGWQLQAAELMLLL